MGLAPALLRREAREITDAHCCPSSIATRRCRLDILTLTISAGKFTAYKYNIAVSNTTFLFYIP